MYEIAFITDQLRQIGFELAGISGIHQARNSDEALGILKELTQRDDIGIIIISDHLMPHGEGFDQMMTRSFPVIISVPSSRKMTDTSSREYLMEFIQKAIGISIEV